MKLKKLLNETPEAMYWLGVLASDGSFTKSSSGKLARARLCVNDKELVENLKIYTGVNNKISKVDNRYSIAIMDTPTIQELVTKYNVNSCKTYNPMVVRNISEDLFISYFIGFIDGDGCIKLQTKRITPRLSIKCHSSWLPEFKYWHTTLQELTGEVIAGPKLNKAGYCVWNIGSLLILKYLKLKSRKLQLPCLERKWGVINLKVVNSANIRELQRRYFRVEIPKLKELGMNYKEIASKLKIQPTRVYQYTNFKEKHGSFS